MPALPTEAEGFAIVWAADIWYSVKKHWALEAQRLVRAKRAALVQPWGALDNRSSPRAGVNGPEP